MADQPRKYTTSVRNLLIVQPDCSVCLRMEKDLEKQKPENVAIVVVPSREGEQMLQTLFSAFAIGGQSDWFVEAPRAVGLVDEICGGGWRAGCVRFFQPSSILWQNGDMCTMKGLLGKPKPRGGMLFVGEGTIFQERYEWYA